MRSSIPATITTFSFPSCDTTIDPGGNPLQMCFLVSLLVSFSTFVPLSSVLFFSFVSLPVFFSSLSSFVSLPALFSSPSSFVSLPALFSSLSSAASSSDFQHKLHFLPCTGQSMMAAGRGVGSASSCREIIADSRSASSTRGCTCVCAQPTTGQCRMRPENINKNTA